MFPPIRSSSTIRNKADMRLDFPAPVLPTMPSLSPGLISTFSDFKTSGRPNRYRNDTSLKTKIPSPVLKALGLSVLISHSGSWGKSLDAKSRTLSTLVTALKKNHHHNAVNGQEVRQNE